MRQSEGQFERFNFIRKCNGSKGLSHDLVHFESLESYQLDDLPADGREKRNHARIPTFGTATILLISFNRDRWGVNRERRWLESNPLLPMRPRAPFDLCAW
jgi:hypothetical protein